MFWPIYLPLLSLTWRLAFGDRLPSTNNTNYRSVAYYVNWAVYERNFLPQDLPVEDLTHVLYAFANINNLTGEVYLSDKWADTEKEFTERPSNATGTNLHGCFQQLYILKKANRHLKVLLSIGGAKYKDNFATPASSASGRSTFASSAVDLVQNLGLDGIDVDWEFPKDDTQASSLVLLLQSIREALDAYGESFQPRYHFQLTAASPAGPLNYRQMHLADMDKYLDFWNLMAWDYSGSWSPIVAHQANIFQSVENPATTPYDTQAAVQYYISQGIIPSKLVLGIPLYGRSFNATDGLGKQYEGVGRGTWEAGVYDSKDLPLFGAVESYDSVSGSSYSYDATKRELVSYDNVVVAKQKATWVRHMKLGGVAWWESSADRVGNKSLIQNAIGVLREEDSSGLDNDFNELIYLNSSYDNLRAGMPDSWPLQPCSTLSISIPSSARTMSFLNSTMPAIDAVQSVFNESRTTTTITVPCASVSKALNSTAIYANSSSESSVELSTQYTTVYLEPTTSTTTVYTIVYASQG